MEILSTSKDYSSFMRSQHQIGVGVWIPNKKFQKRCKRGSLETNEATSTGTCSSSTTGHRRLSPPTSPPSSPPPQPPLNFTLLLPKSESELRPSRLFTVLLTKPARLSSRQTLSSKTSLSKMATNPKTFILIFTKSSLSSLSVCYSPQFSISCYGL